MSYSGRFIGLKAQNDAENDHGAAWAYFFG
jgi:hypothetical protein